MDLSLGWLALVLSVVLLGSYELRLARIARHTPSATARSAHRLLRGEWVRALSAQPGSEILAVQALRNSLMSATITASTAALVLMGTVSLMVSNDEARALSVRFSLRVVLETMLVLMLFATYVCAAMAMRYYHHAGFALSLPVGCRERKEREELAVAYVQRAGVLYSWSLRWFLFAAPFAVGILSVVMMPVSALCLVVALAFFDRMPEIT